MAISTKEQFKTKYTQLVQQGYTYGDEYLIKTLHDEIVAGGLNLDKVAEAFNEIHRLSPRNGATKAGIEAKLRVVGAI